MKLYEVRKNGETITEHESDRQTDHFVFVNGTRYGWDTQWSKFFKDRKEAKDYLFDNCIADIRNLQKRIEYQQERLEKIYAL